jgi:hypothetical protein
LPSARVSSVDGTNARIVFEHARVPGSSSTDTERGTDLVWTPDSAQLVVVVRSDGTPARARIVLVDLSPSERHAATPAQRSWLSGISTRLGLSTSAVRLWRGR